MRYFETSNAIDPGTSGQPPAVVTPAQVPPPACLCVVKVSQRLGAGGQDARANGRGRRHLTLAGSPGG